jgi:hypothetical protein
MVTVPGTLAPLAVSLIVNVVAGEIRLAGSITRLKVAVINLPGPAPVLTDANWFPLLGSDAVTFGIVALALLQLAPGATLPVPPGTIPLPPPPPLPPPHPAMAPLSSRAMNHISGFGEFSILFMCVS